MKISNAANEVKLGKIKGRAYVKALAVFIKNVLKPGVTLPFIALIQHKYPDLNPKQSKMLPLLLFGTQPKFWKEYYRGKDEAGNSNQSRLFMGKVTRTDNTFMFDIDKNKSAAYSSGDGKKSLQFMQALFQRINKDFSIQVKGSSLADQTDVSVQEKKELDNKNIEQDVKTSNENSAYKDAKEEYQKVAQLEVNELAEAMEAINEFLATDTIKKVKKKIKKKEPITKKEYKLLQDTLDVLIKGGVTHKKSKKQVKSLFKFFDRDLEKKKKDLYKLIKIATVFTKSDSDIVTLTLAKKALNRDLDYKEMTRCKDVVQYALVEGKKQKISSEDTIRLMKQLLRRTKLKKFTKANAKKVVNGYATKQKTRA